MQRIVVAAKAGSDQPWLADAAAQLAPQTGASVYVVALDGVDIEALSSLPRSEYQATAQSAVDGLLERLPPPASRPRARSAPAPWCPASCSTPKRRTPT